jgi:PAS domain-containing protein
MHNKHWMLLGWASAAVLAVSSWTAGGSAPTGDSTATQPPPWTGPEAETAPLWPELVLPLLLLGAAVAGHAWWRARRHRRQLQGLQVDMHDGLEAQSQLLTLAGLLPVGISHVEEDANGQLLARFVNPRMAELLGVRLDDMQFDAKAGWRHIQPDDLRQANMALSQAAANVRRGVPQADVETLCRVQRDERTRWLRLRSQLRLASGEAGRHGVVHIHTCAEDITDLRRHQKFSQDVLDGYPAPVRIRDLAGRHLLTNPAFDRLHLLRPGESLGKTDAELLPLDVQRLYHAVDDQLATSGQPQVFEQTLADAGGPRTHQVTQFLLRDEDQRPYATCAISTDVSDHQAAQGRLQRVLDASPMPVLITSAGRVVYANRRCTDLLDVRVGTTAAHLYADPAEQQRLEQQVAHEGHVTAHKLHLRGPDAATHELWMTAVPTDHNGQQAILSWLEPPTAEARRPAHLRAVDRAA